MSILRPKSGSIHLDITRRIEPDFGLRIDNAGQGAAIIDVFEIYLDGKEVPDIITGNPYRSALVASGISKIDDDGNDIGTALITTIDKGIAIKAGSEIYIYKWEKLPTTIDEMNQMISRIDVRVVYSSLSDQTYCVLYKGGEFAEYKRDIGAACKL